MEKMHYKKSLRKDILIAFCIKILIMTCLIGGMKWMKNNLFVIDPTRSPFLNGE